MIKNWILNSLFLFVLSLPSIASSQELNIFYEDIAALPGDTISVDLRVSDFDDIGSIQFSLNWSNTELEFLSYSTQSLTNGLAINPNQASSGVLVFSWFDISGSGLSLTDGSSILQIDFLLLTCPQNTLSLAINDNPLSIQVLQVQNGINTFIDLNAEVAAFTPLPFFNLGPDTTLCNMPSFDLIADCPTCQIFEWNDGSSDPAIFIDSIGLYSITVTDGSGCTDSDTLEVALTILGELDLGADQSICEEDSTVLNAGDIIGNYEWSDGSIADTFLVNQAGDYSLTVTDDFGCSTADTVSIILLPSPSARLAAEFSILCPEDSSLLFADGEGSFSWIDTSGTLSPSFNDEALVTPQYNTQYQLIARNECGTDTASIVITTYELQIVAYNDTCVVKGEEVPLRAEGGTDYTWQAFPTLEVAPLANPIVQPEETTLFVLIGQDENGCTDTDTIEVLIVENPFENMDLYNAITPNGDGLNDQLYIDGLEKFPENMVIVFTRWGEVLYEKENYQTDDELWDGKYKGGKKVPAGVYYYSVEVDGKRLVESLMVSY